MGEIKNPAPVLPTPERDIHGKPLRKSFYSTVSLSDAKKKAEEYRVASDAGGRWHLDWVEAQATVDQRDDDGRPLNLIGSSLVITPRKRLEQDLRSARDRAEESNRLK